MPASSQKQWRFMKAVAAGDVKQKGLSKAEATEYISSQPTPEGLPEKAKRKAFHRVVNKISKATKGKRFRV